MKPLTAAEIRGNWATLLLPIQTDDSIDFRLLADEIDHFIGARVSGVYSNGSAGEFYTQGESEFDQLHAVLAEKCERAGLPFQIGLSQPSAQLALDRLRRSRALQPSAFQVTLPDWFPPNLEEAISFLSRMAETAAPIPLVVYNPPHAKRRFEPAEWRDVLARVPGLVGMKVPGGDEQWYADMQPVLQRFSVFIPGHLLGEGLKRGAAGAYSNVACLSPRGAQCWYEQCVADPAAGAAVGKRVAAFWSAHIAPLITRDGLSNMAADKAAAVAGGWLPGLTTRLRWPYESIETAKALTIGQNARRMLPEFFQ
jgi:dihydrodipicolinate synthase/N-acetylneuraminate lyase